MGPGPNRAQMNLLEWAKNPNGPSRAQMNPPPPVPQTHSLHVFQIDTIDVTCFSPEPGVPTATPATTRHDKS